MLRPLLIFLAMVLLLTSWAFADQEFNLGSALSGTEFRILDPQHAGFGGTSSSSSPNFRMLGTIGDLGIGPSSGATHGLLSGFLYFPFIQQPTLTSATPGTNEVSLTWTAAQAQAGLTVSGYNVCTQPSAGSYTCEDVGNTLSFTKTGLSGGTSYTFKIQAYDAYNNVIAESNELSATPTGAAPGGGGGGGGAAPTPTLTPTPTPTLTPTPTPGGASLEVSGLAYPFSPVHVLRDGVELGTTTANAQAAFTFSQGNIAPGSALLGFWAVDAAGRRSVIWSFTVTLVNGPNRITGLILPPTISLSSNTVEPGQSVTVNGSSAPGATVRVDMDVAGGRQQTTLAGSDGTYTTTLSTTGLPSRIYHVKARTEFPPGGDQSIWSQLVRLGVGVPLFPEAGQQPPAPTGAPGLPALGPLGSCPHDADINQDGRVDLVDFSIMAFWWHRPVPQNAPFDLNCDGLLTLADFSILAYHWTGR